MAEINLDDLEISEDDLRRVQEAFDAKLLRLKHPYVFDLIRVLARWPKGLKRMIALDYMISNRTKAGLHIPKTFDNTVQSSMQYYCRDSDEFKKRFAPPEDALFCWPKGKGAGVWAIVRENAAPWVRANRELLPQRVLGGKLL